MECIGDADDIKQAHQFITAILDSFDQQFCALNFLSTIPVKTSKNNIQHNQKIVVKGFNSAIIWRNNRYVQSLSH